MNAINGVIDELKPGFAITCRSCGETKVVYSPDLMIKSQCATCFKQETECRLTIKYSNITDWDELLAHCRKQHPKMLTRDMIWLMAEYSGERLVEAFGKLTETVNNTAKAIHELVRLVK